MDTERKSNPLKPGWSLGTLFSPPPDSDRDAAWESCLGKRKRSQGLWGNHASSSMPRTASRCVSSRTPDASVFL